MSTMSTLYTMRNPQFADYREQYSPSSPFNAGYLQALAQSTGYEVQVGGSYQDPYSLVPYYLLDSSSTAEQLPSTSAMGSVSTAEIPAADTSAVAAASFAVAETALVGTSATGGAIAPLLGTGARTEAANIAGTSNAAREEETTTPDRSGNVFLTDGMRYHGEVLPGRPFPKEVTAGLNAWYNKKKKLIESGWVEQSTDSRRVPGRVYISQKESQDLASKLNLSVKQVLSWLSNKRRGRSKNE